MADEFFIGDDFDELKVTLLSNGRVVPFNGASVRWWLAVDRDGDPAFTPKTVTDTSPNSFANGFYYPVLTAAETTDLESTDYWVVTEITLAGKIRTFADQRITFSGRGGP